MVFASVILTIALGLLIIERRIISTSVMALQTRIHVNGTRGKSSVVKYIAAGLSVKDPSVLAKVTGVIPSLISSGIVQVLGRTGVARVQEQFSIMKLAKGRGINTLVLECMSIAPELQQLESRVFKPHIYVITNIKDDHREAMGISLREQAESICNAIPESCTVITNELVFLDLIKEKAEIVGSRVVVPDTDKLLADIDLPKGVFPQNVALALSVCEQQGTKKEECLETIIKTFDKEESPYTIVNTGSGNIHFLNAFSVNDADSTETFINYWRDKTGSDQEYSVLFNTRADRPLRTDMLSEWLAANSSRINKILLVGDHSRRAYRMLSKSSVDKKNIHLLKRNSIQGLKNRLLTTVPEDSLLVGIGNIGGYGLLIMEELT